ncbi:MAG TPA: hypothetical protein VFV66_06365 [Nonomuraea sp.]|nr:hypothetical protein [Nonomuraea sp.]
MATPENVLPHPRLDEGVRHGRLTARPALTRATAEPGTYNLDSRAVLRVPPGARRRLAVVLHGAGGNAHQALQWLAPHADAAGIVLLAPDSIASTWDMIVGGYGPDVTRLDAALAEAFAGTPVDAGQVAVAGFSDGASYALSLGVANGDLFRAVLAFSPGFMAPMVRHGEPRIHLAHGTRDRVLPIDSCSRRLVSRLREQGYPVTYHEFEGGHEVPPEMVSAAVRWWLPE